jgi:hypothetical protein
MGVKIPSPDQGRFARDFINSDIIRPVQAHHNIGINRKFKPALMPAPGSPGASLEAQPAPLIGVLSPGSLDSLILRLLKKSLDNWDDRLIEEPGFVNVKGLDDSRA